MTLCIQHWSNRFGDHAQVLEELDPVNEPGLVARVFYPRSAYALGYIPPNYPVPAIPYETIVSITGRFYVLPINVADMEFNS
jgi:hypothetical protein